MDLLVFLIPLALGIIIALGMGLGLGDLHGHMDGSLDHHGGGHGHATLSVLGWGRTPFLLSLAVAVLLFGGIGIILTWYGLPLLASIPLSMLTTYVLGGLTTTRISKWIPALETSSTHLNDFLGREATVTLPATESTHGRIQVRLNNDIYEFNYLHNANLKLKQGEQALVASVDSSRVCTLMEDPTK